MKTQENRLIAVVAGLFCLALPGAEALAQDSSDPVPVNIMFLVDASSSMEQCFSQDNLDTTGDGIQNYCTSGSRFEAVQAILKEASGSIGNAYIGLAQSDPSLNHAGIGSSPDEYGFLTSTREGIVAPLGSTVASFNAGVDSLTLNIEDGIAHAEMLRDMVYHFYSSEYHCDDPDLCIGTTIDYYCQKNYIIILTDGTSDPAYGNIDANALFDYYPAVPDSSSTVNPSMDNLASQLANSDFNIALAGTQSVTTYVMGLDIEETDDIVLFDNVAQNASSLFTVSNSYDSLRGDIFAVLSEILEGSYQEMPPVLSTDGDMLVMGWYDVNAYRPIYNGQMLGYDIETDPYSASYGEIITTGNSPWDAGTILESRDVQSAEIREINNFNNGELIRDIFTNIDQDGTPDAFDSANIEALCPLMLDTSAAPDAMTPSSGVLAGHDLNYDGVVDELDCQDLVDFIRGYSLSEFRSTGLTRGYWKLGSIRHSQPAFADPNPDIFTRNPYLREFMTDYLPEKLMYCPDPGKGLKSCDARVSFVTANDGMLHAFNTNTGDELWGYIPRNLLGQTLDDSIERAELLDLMWSERVLMDASPTVAFVWIDGYEGQGEIGTPDGSQEAGEWVRVLLVGQGDGGRYYLALDITQPDEPYILWEEDFGGGTAFNTGATTSTPAVGLIMGNGDDHWVSFVGSGQEVDSEPLFSRLYIKALGDFQGITESYANAAVNVVVDLDGDMAHDGTGFPSNPTIIDRDNDGDTDEVLLVNSAGVVYKFVIDTADIDNTSSCLFFDPQNANLDDGLLDQYVGKRTSSYWSATAAVNGAGEVLVYFGTGSPYDLFTTDRGYFYAIKDPVGCTEGLLYTDCDDDGMVELDVGEKLMGAPVVYDRVVYFSTYAPSSDRCSAGEARLYGMDYLTCAAAFDTNGSGSSGDGDDLYEDLGEGMPSGVVVANDSIYVATTQADASAPTGEVTRVDAANGPFGSTINIQWREMF